MYEYLRNPSQFALPPLSESITDQNLKQAFDLLITAHHSDQHNTVTPQKPLEEEILSIHKHPKGTRIGQYIVDSYLASGGMGSVYLANRSDSIDQPVAIKVFNSVEGIPNNIDRFERERQILAYLEHPNIARLIDAGTHEGQLYFVMEYVKGLEISRHCQKFNLSLKGRLELFLQVCDAIEYAHRNFIVHRDIKPGNVIVNEDGMVKLLDFGVAKLIEQHLPEISLEQTQINTQVLTPLFAAPEQIEGKPITVGCDVYQLGLLLYLILTETHTFEQEGLSWAEVEHTVVHVLPKPPSKQLRGNQHYQAKQLQGDLDAIILHALNKDPADRYTSVAQFIDDVKCYLHNKPIKIRYNQTIYRLKKRLTKHWLAFTSLATIVLVITVSLGLIFQQRNDAIKQKLRAEFISDVFISAFKNADPTRTNGKNISALAVVEQVSHMIDQETLDDKPLKVELAATLSAVYRNLGAIDRSRQILSQVEGELSAVDENLKTQFASELLYLSIMDGSHHPDELFEMIEKAIVEHGKKPLLLYIKALNARISTRYVEGIQAIETYFYDLKSDDELFLPSCSLYGYLLTSNKLQDDADKVFNLCLDYIESNPSPHSQWEASQIYFARGRMYLSKQDHTRAIAGFHQSITIRNDMNLLSSHHKGEPHIFLSDAYLLSGDLEKALKHAEIAMSHRKDYLNSIPADKHGTYLAKPLFRIANYYQAAGHHQEAKAAYEDVIQKRIQGGAAKELNTAQHHQKYAQLLCTMGLFEEANNAFSNADNIFKQPKYQYKELIKNNHMMWDECTTTQ